MPTDIDTQLRLQDIRLRVLNHDTVTTEEYRDLLLDLRADRENAARAGRQASAKARTAAKPPVEFDLTTLFGGAKQ